MATVPTLSRSGLGNVKGVPGITPFQSLRTNPDMFGADQGRALQEAGAGITDAAFAYQKILDDQQREEDERHMMEIEQKVRDWKFETLQGEAGVYNQRGGNVIGATKGVGDGYKQFSSTLLEGRELSNKARLRVQGFIKEQGTSIAGEVSRYERKEKLGYDNGLREARIKGASEEAALYYNEPEKLAAAEAKIRSTHARSAAANGWSAEEAAVQVHQSISTMHASVIGNMLTQKDTASARDYVMAHGDDMTAADSAKARRLVASETVVVESQDIAAKAINLFPNDPSAAAQWVRDNSEGELENKGIAQLDKQFGESEATQEARDRQLARQDREDARAKRGEEARDRQLARQDREDARAKRGEEGVREVKSRAASNVAIGEAGTEAEARDILDELDLTAKVQARAEEHVRSHFAAQERAAKSADKEMRKAATAKYASGDDLTPEEDLALDSVIGLRQRLDKEKERRAAGLPQVSDEGVRQELMMMYLDDKNQFSDVDLYGGKYGGKLSKEHLAGFERKLEGLNKAEVKAAEQGKQLSRAKSIAVPMLKEAGFKVGGKNDNTAGFITRLTEQLESLPDDHTLSQLDQDTRYQNVIIGMLLQGEDETDDLFGDPNLRAFESKGGFYSRDFTDENEEAIATLAKRSNVEASRVGAIVQALIQRGQPTTVANIQQINEALKAQGK